MGDLSSLDRSMTLYATRVGRNVNETKKATARAVQRAVVLGTPVDTGKARSNWVVSVNDDTTNVLAPYKPGVRLGIGETANASAAIAQGDGVIDGVQPGDNIYISNNVDYIGVLNDGSSSQAPASFVQSAVLLGVDTVQNSKVVL